MMSYHIFRATVLFLTFADATAIRPAREARAITVYLYRVPYRVSGTGPRRGCVPVHVQAPV